MKKLLAAAGGRDAGQAAGPAGHGVQAGMIVVANYRDRLFSG